MLTCTALRPQLRVLWVWCSERREFLGAGKLVGQHIRTPGSGGWLPATADGKCKRTCKCASCPATHVLSACLRSYPGKDVSLRVFLLLFFLAAPWFLGRLSVESLAGAFCLLTLCMQSHGKGWDKQTNDKMLLRFDATNWTNLATSVSCMVSLLNGIAHTLVPYSGRV